MSGSLSNLSIMLLIVRLHPFDSVGDKLGLELSRQAVGLPPWSMQDPATGVVMQDRCT